MLENCNIFEENLHLIEQLFSKSLISKRKSRLKQIFKNVEKSWWKNIARFKDNDIKYILIAEAAPWSNDGQPRYFYNQIESKYHLKIWKAFYPDIDVPSDKELSYKMLADKNFLFIDSIPFSMEYTPSKRRNKAYIEIINNSLDWWIGKINNENIKLANNVKVAFAFKLNGLAIIQETKGILKLKNGQIINLTNDLIAADSSGYTNSVYLRNIYDL